ncbi:ABC transporter permease [Paenibacillus sp. SAF-054]|uniref:ABC transporter permease n=1 Tax=unclassified Paenibacillus TaxID=185978 RepID=UPI003F80E32D
MKTDVFPSPLKRGRRRLLSKEFRKNYDLYLLLIPGILFFFIFSYVPMGGIVIAFKDYNIFKGILESDWAGLHYFKEMVSLPNFWTIVRNTLMLSILSLIFGFPAPIILSLMLNEIRLKWFKRVSQSLLYIPHFMSWIILSGIVYNILSPTYGVINELLRKLGLGEIYFMVSENWWVSTYIASGIWQNVGWGTIIYLAAMSAIDPSLYEAAEMDGASRMRKIWHVTIPGIAPTIIILLILNIGDLATVGFEKVFALQNAAVLEVSQVVSTFIYTYGLLDGNYSLATAVNTVESIINLILILGSNYIVKATGREGLW